MIGTVALFHPREGSEAEVESLLSSLVAPSRAEPGCLDYDLYRERLEGPRFVLVERYRDQDAVEAHRRSSHYLAYRSRIFDLVDQPIDAVLLDPLDVMPSRSAGL